MTRHRALSLRLGRAEAAGGPSTPPVPCVVTVGTYDTPAGALAAFAAAYPDRPRRHAPLIVPAKPATPAEREAFAERFQASQLQLVANARSERVAIVSELPAEPMMPLPLRSAPETTPARMKGGSTFAATNRLNPGLFARLADISFNDR